MKTLSLFFAAAGFIGYLLLALAAARLDARLAWPAVILAAGSLFGLYILWGIS